MFINVGVDVLIGALPQSCFMMNGSPYFSCYKIKSYSWMDSYETSFSKKHLYLLWKSVRCNIDISQNRKSLETEMTFMMKSDDEIDQGCWNPSKISRV